jgi:hypothetical protein
MTKLERTLLEELSALPEERRADVLAFVRYLRLSIPEGGMEIEKGFARALRSIRRRAKKLKITQEDIDAEIRAERKEGARRS